MNRTIREELEQYEQDYLSPYASKSAETRGRDREEPACDIRPAYQRDRDRILHCKSFRRLKHKTQVFLSPAYAGGFADCPHDCESAADERGSDGSDRTGA